MKLHLKRFLSKENIPLILLHVIYAVIFFMNLNLNRMFIGWDSVNTELNFGVNFQRALFSGWQEYYGVGLLGGHGFAALLPYTIFMFLLSLVFDQVILRTLYSLIFMYLGSLGMYLLVRKILSQSKLQITGLPELYDDLINWLSLIAGLNYLMNLGTVQQLYTQTDAFTFHYTALPWLFYGVLLILHKQSKLNYGLFFLINFFSSTQGFVPPVFLAYIMALTIFLGLYIYLQGFRFIAIKKSLIVLILTVIVNLYWLLPFGYYNLTNNNVFLNSYNNMRQTPEFIEKSKKFGVVEEVVFIKGFFWESQELEGFLFQPWHDHFNRPLVKQVGVVLFLISLIGVAGTFIRKRNAVLLSFTGVYMFFFTSLTTNSPPFSYVTLLLHTISPSLRQAFRTAFTKFSLGLAFSYSLFIAIGSLYLYLLMRRYSKFRQLSSYFIVLLAMMVLYYGYPYLEGNAFYKHLFTPLPKAYTQIIEYFKNEGDGRIAEFPQDCAEGWYYYNWNYYGSGFLWYGVKQPYMSRTFDVWSNYNENYYWEIVQALREENTEKLDKILDKYDIRWILYDNNMRHCRSEKALTHLDSLKEYLNKSEGYRLVKTFQTDNLQPILLYERKYRTTESYMSVLTGLPNVGPEYKWNDNDSAYHNNLIYYTHADNPYHLYLPFRSMYTKRNPLENEVAISETDEEIIFTQTIPPGLSGYNIQLNPYYELERVIPAVISIIPINSNRHQIKLLLQFPQITLDGKPLNQTEEILLGEINVVSTNDFQVFLNGILLKPSAKGDYETVLSLVTTNNLEVTNNQNTPLFRWSADTETFFKIHSGQLITSKIPDYSSGELQVHIPKIQNNTTLYTTIENENLTNTLPHSCLDFSITDKNTHEISEDSDSKYVRLISEDSDQCFSLNFPQAETNLGYLLKLQGRNVAGLNPLLIVTNKTRISHIETYLPLTSDFQQFYFILPPNIPNELGYDVTFRNTSFNSTPTINDLGPLSLTYIPYNYLRSLVFSRPESSNSTTFLFQEFFTVKHPNETTYWLQTDSQNIYKDSLITLYQGYHPAWVAYQVSDDSFINRHLPFLFGKKLDEHVKLNNWANAWIIDDLKDADNISISVVFWPQYLEFIGFGLLIIGVLCIYIKPKNK